MIIPGEPELGRLDVLVNNAAIAVVGPIDKSPPQAELDRQLTVNYVSVVAAIRAAADVMTDGGRIVNIGSGVATRTGVPGIADHAASKAALAGFTRGAARDLAGRGITVNLLQTGLVDTELSRSTGGNPERLLQSVPLKRFGTPEEIAAGVLFLASPEASYVTGATLDIDGGFGAMNEKPVQATIGETAAGEANPGLPCLPRPGSVSTPSRPVLLGPPESR